MKFRIQTPGSMETAGKPTSLSVYPFLPCMLKQAAFILFGIAVFGGGLLIGHFATTQWPGSGSWFGAEKPVDAVALQKLKDELHLTPAQAARIAPVITAACTDLRLLSEERRARRLELLDDISATIAPELTADQQRHLEQFEAESRDHTGSKRDQRIVALF
ncbi:MAG TPA: hypothetical protein VHY22_18045 [Chthoniobacteraceae bacterium]|jgi:hypothetical protein|nr:hypothetical protein [Chthoniobacteraceae bacterium]